MRLDSYHSFPHRRRGIGSRESGIALERTMSDSEALFESSLRLSLVSNPHGKGEKAGLLSLMFWAR